MLNAISKDELLELTSQEQSPSISLIIPTYETGVSRTEAPIRLKNLVSTVEKELIAEGNRATTVKDFLQPIRDFGRDHGWTHQGESLAIFRSEGTFKTFELPRRFDEQAVIDRRFFVRPLIPLLDDQAFYILVLDQSNVRLLKGNRNGATEVSVPDLPHTKNQAVHVGHQEKQMQAHTAGPSGRHGSMIADGGYNYQDGEKEVLKHFCEAINRALTPVVNHGSTPLILAGVDYLTNLYREVSPYKHIDPKALHGSHKTESDRDLAHEASAIINGDNAGALARENAKFEELLGTGLGSTQLDEILVAAENGRVETLFLRDGVLTWGKFDQENQTSHHSAERGLGDEELLNLAAIQTMKHGGMVHECPPEEMSNGHAAAASFRF